MDQEIRITLRLPAQLKERVANRALIFGRSLNAEIVGALEKAYPDNDAQLQEAIRLVEERVAAAGDNPDPRLVKLARNLQVQQWFEPIEDDK